MKSKTYLRAAARQTGMDAGNLSKLAEKWGVPLDDKTTLVALAYEHQREPMQPDSDAAALRAGIDRIFKRIHRQAAKHHEEGAQIIKDLLKENDMQLALILDMGNALQPALQAPWHGMDGLQLTAEQLSTIQNLFGDSQADAVKALEGLRQRQHELEALKD